MELEESFRITVPDQDYEKIKTAGDAVAYFDERR